MSHQPERTSVRFQKPWARAQRLMPKCDSYSSNGANASVTWVSKGYRSPWYDNRLTASRRTW
jgi:hypothetical protein